MTNGIAYILPETLSAALEFSIPRHGAAGTSWSRHPRLSYDSIHGGYPLEPSALR